MRYAIALLFAFAFANSVYGAAGDVIKTFTLTGQPSYGVRGLAYDWSDGNVWAAGPNTNYDISLGKFNPTSASVIGSWRHFLWRSKSAMRKSYFASTSAFPASTKRACASVSSSVEAPP